MAEAAPAPVLVYDRVSANRRATRRLLAIFTVLLLPFIAGLIPPLTPLILFGVLLPVLGEAAFDRINATPEGAGLMFAATIGIALVVVLAAAIAVARVELAHATRLVLRLTRARPVAREAEPELHRTVENLSLAAGLPAPRVYVIEARAPNALATGLDPERSVVVVTRGLLRLLDRRGLHGVIAHELSHIGNQDVRLGTVLAAVLAVLRAPLAVLSRTGLTRHPLLVRGCLALSGVMAVLAALSVLGVLAEIVLALVFFSGELRGALAATKRASVPELLLVGSMLFYGPLVLASPFYVLFGAQLCGRRVSGAVSRQREYLADGDAVLLTRDPEGLALALVKIAAASGAPMDLSRAAAHLFLVEPRLAEAGWWEPEVASHPPVEERIALLGRMGAGISPEALETARQAGERFREESRRRGHERRRAAPSTEEPAPDHSPRIVAPSPPTHPTLWAAASEPPGGGHLGEAVLDPGIVCYVRLAEGPVALLDAPAAMARARGQLSAGTLLVLLAVEGEFLRVQTPDGAAGYIEKSTAVIWGS